jgi:hypothetical protein
MKFASVLRQKMSSFFLAKRFVKFKICFAMVTENFEIFCSKKERENRTKNYIFYSG